MEKNNNLRPLEEWEKVLRTEENFEELKDCTEGIKELIEYEKGNIHFLNSVLFKISELEERVQNYRKLYFKPQPKKK